MEPERILRIVSVMNRGGIESQIMNLYRQIDREKYQFDFLVTRDETGIFDEEIKELGGKIYRIAGIKESGLLRFLKNINSFFEKHKEFNIVHCHMNTWSGLFLNVARYHKVPVRIAQSHSSSKSLEVKDFKSFKTTTFKHVMKTLIKFGATDYWAVSKEAGEWLFGSKSLNMKVQIFPNAKNVRKYQFNKKERDIVRRNMNIAFETKVIGHVASLSEVKNHGFSLNLLKNLKNRKLDYKLLIIGDGKLKESLILETKKLKLENEVSFLGARNDVPTLMNALDILILPSIYEGIPNVVIESQLSGLQSIVSDSVSRDVDLDINKVDFIKTTDLDKWITTIESLDIHDRSFISNDNIKYSYNIEHQIKWLEEFYKNKLNGISN